jgi:hypothetical protein
VNALAGVHFLIPKQEKPVVVLWCGLVHKNHTQHSQNQSVGKMSKEIVEHAIRMSFAGKKEKKPTQCLFVNICGQCNLFHELGVGLCWVTSNAG